MTRVILLLTLASIIQTQSLSPDFIPKSIKQQFATSTTNNINFLRVLPVVAAAIGVTSSSAPAFAVDKKSFEYQPALAGLDYGKPRTYYPDFVQKTSGLQYKVVKEGRKGYVKMFEKDVKREVRIYHSNEHDDPA